MDQQTNLGLIIFFLHTALTSLRAKYPSLIPEALREEQVEALKILLSGNHCLAILPTGFGKTLIAVLFPLILDEVNYNDTS
jgi:Lhr-like helicase